jgi:hypothetical protein
MSIRQMVRNDGPYTEVLQLAFSVSFVFVFFHFPFCFNVSFVCILVSIQIDNLMLHDLQAPDPF